MVNFIVWNNQFSVSVAALDAEHQKIIGIINRMYEAKNQRNATLVLSQALSDLTTYAMTHFAHEEILMARYQYPDWKKHRLEHRAFVKKIALLRMNYMVNADKVLEDLFDYLKTWWQNHILIEDKKYGPFFKAKGVK